MHGPPRAAGDEASGQIIAFLVASLAFLGSFTALIVETQQAAPDREGVAAPGREMDADAFLDMILDSPGVGWEEGADGVLRVGLANDNGTGIDLSRLDLLRNASWTADAANGLVDRAELARSLGLDPARTDFNLTIEPVDPDKAVIPATFGQLPRLKVGYIGDWQPLATVKVQLALPDAMESEARATIDTRMLAGAARDRAVMDMMNMEFNNNVFISLAAPTILVDYPRPLSDQPLLSVLNVPLLEGDVYPDDKGYMDAVLPGRLSRYEVLFVGSDMDHNALTSAGTKNAIRDWVLAGGTLFVLGSASASSNWIIPLFDSRVESASGGVQAPDPGAGALHIPNDLQWQAYAYGTKGWNLRDSEALFEHVLVSGSGHDVLAVSRPGSFGTGNVALSTVLLQPMADSLGDQEAVNFLTNILLSAGLGESEELVLTFYYGPAPPLDREVASAVRYSQVWTVVYGWVPLRIELRVWGPS